MADFSISGRMSVAGLQRQFNKAFGLELRVYKGPKFADPKATLASLSNKKVDDFECKGNTKVGNFETKFEKATGLKVQVATLPSADGKSGALVSDDLTLSQAAKLGSEKMIADKEIATNEKAKTSVDKSIVSHDYVHDWNLDNNQVLVVAGDWAFNIAEKYGIYECQNKRTFRPSRYMAFYKDGQINTVFEIVEKPYDNGTGNNTPEMAKMKADMPDYDANTPRRVIKLKHLGAVGPVKNDSKSHSGKNVPFSYGQPRYTTLDRMQKAKLTSELVTGIKEEPIVLETKGDSTIINPDEATIKLVWSTNEDFDLAVIYNTKSNLYGQVYFGNKGNLNSFPYIQLDKDEMSGVRVKTETILINHLNEMQKVAIIAWDYSNHGRMANFDKSDVKIIIVDSNGFESIAKLKVESQSDSVCVASIENTANGFVFENVSKSFMRSTSEQTNWDLIF